MDKKSLAMKLKSDVASVCVCRKTRETARKISRIYDDMLQPAGIKATQFTMLAAIALQVDSTLTELAETLGMDRTTLSRNLKPLERSGLIRVSAEGYRRARSASITNKGATTMEKALPLWQSAQKLLKKRIGNETWDRIQLDLSEIGQRL
jgi:DNA-binding MarR family transcriptional regulator